MEIKEPTLAELLDYIWFVAGPIHPGIHNLYFNDGSIRPNPLHDYDEFQLHYRKQFLATHNPVNAINSLLGQSSEVEEEVQWEVIELVEAIHTSGRYALAFDQTLFAFTTYDELKLGILQIIDNEQFETKLMALLHEDRTADELMKILELVEGLGDRIVNQVTLAMRNYPGLQTTPQVLAESEFLRSVRNFDAKS